MTTTTALDLANDFLAECAADAGAAEIEHTISAFVLAAEHLHDEGTPLSWREFRADTFFPKIGFLPAHQRVQYALTLVAMFGWLALSGVMTPLSGAALIEDVARHGPDHPVLAEFATRSSTPLRQLPSC